MVAPWTNKPLHVSASSGIILTWPTVHEPVVEALAVRACLQTFRPRPQLGSQEIEATIVALFLRGAYRDCSAALANAWAARQGI